VLFRDALMIMSKRKRIAVLCTLDTKSEHAAFIKTFFEDRGHEAVLIDIGVLGASGLSPEVTRRDLARAAGMDLDELIAAKDRGAALAAMSAGAAATVTRLYREGTIDGILGLGGGSGTAVSTAAMRALPVGFPKVMISTMAATAKVASYVGTRDIVMVNTITDIIGMNPILRSVLISGAAAICGMVETGAETGAVRGNAGRPTVAITAFGATNPAAMLCHDLLTKADCETSRSSRLAVSALKPSNAWMPLPTWPSRSNGSWFASRNVASGGQDSETPHSTQKPVECMRRPMQNNSNPGQAVYDPFLGSGTTLIAAETTGRVCLGMELEPRYVDVAVQRWQEFTGMMACLHGDGRSYDVIATERLTDLQNTNPSPAPAQPVEIRAPE
jgi:hypothetical protein